MNPSIYVVATLAIACGSSPQDRPALPRFENDYAGARIAALASHAPIAVEIWAPW